ncbi:MAG: alanine racemase [bacterium]|nr:MAG: alanine racemase [bacterium]
MDRFPAWVEVSLDAMKWNIDRIREHIPGNVRILLVVKADAYGHGAVRIARFAAECDVHMLGVATLDEGKELREAGITLPILILSPVLTEELDHVLENGLAVTASTFDFAVEASRAAGRCGRPCALHVEVDTGMGRAGLGQEEAIETIQKMKRLEGIELEGIFTHFPASDSDADFTRDQIASFTGIVDTLQEAGIAFTYIHCANSAAILNFPSSHFNMIRPGLLVYGHAPSVVLRDRIEVLPIMSFKTKLVLVRNMPTGASISYGRTYITPEPVKMGIVPVGYGHGMSHRLSNEGRMLFRGERVPIIGRVTMDMTMIDLSEFPDAQVGEEVVIFGRQGEGEITADHIAQWDGTLNYEVLCRISKRVVRVYIKSGKVDSLKTLLGVHEV